MEYINDGAWFHGLDSISFELGQGFYQWSQNITNRGGMLGTRQGLAQLTSIVGEAEKPRGICLFAPFIQGINPYLVIAVGQYVYKIPPPYTAPLDEAHRIANVSFPTDTRAVHFEVCVQAQKNVHQNGGDEVVDITPRFVLMMTDGVRPPGYWYFEGNTSKSGHTVPTAHNTANPPWNTPIGDYFKWAGDRLWVGKGNKMYAGDLLNPLQFEEQRITASGGFFFLPGQITGMGVTHDYKSLLVFTEQTTSAFQVGIEQREVWSQTQDFQRVIFPTIGNVSHRSFINQYGMSWWISHDGVVALDTSLQTYQTSRMQVKDHNMSRSKEGVNWRNGGGCAGTFSNWLFFSVPSGSRYNVHTWVMDQSVQQNLNTITPPAWCSNWTGIRPEQWVTGAVNGVQRCFCLSHDLVPLGHQSTVWEAFIGQRMDVPMDAGVRKTKDIGCAFETRFVGLGPNQYAKFRYAELDLAEIVGNVHLQVFYCGRRTSYKKILDKKITASVSPSTEVIFDPDQQINIFVPQFRTVRTVTDSHEESDANTDIQTPYIRSIDREFSLLVTWTGQMAVTGLRLCVDPMPGYQEGVCEEDELTLRRITAEGTGEIFSDPPPANEFVQAFTSKFLAPLRPRWVEFPSYDSAVANDVFFVDIPTFDPPGGGYPLGDYTPHKDISILTELEGDTIVYTRDDSTPVLQPLHGTIYTAPVQVTSGQIPERIKARAYREGMIPSVVSESLYSQAHVQNLIVAPAAGPYPAADYPKLVTIVSPTQGATIRYNLTNTPVTVNSPTYTVPVSVAANKWLRTKAFKTGYVDSVESVGHYTVAPQAATPTFTPDVGSYPSGDYPKNITINTVTQGAQLVYHKNAGADITVNAQSVVVAVNSGDLLVAKTRKTGLLDSAIKQGTYTEPTATVAEPTMAPDGGVFHSHQVFPVFHCSTANATMAYNVGTPTNPPDDPTHNQTERRVHDGDQISLTLGHQIVKVIAFKSGQPDSPIHTATFDFEPGG